MAVIMITGEALYRMHRLKRELEAKGKPAKWPYMAAAVLAAWLLMLGR